MACGPKFTDSQFRLKDFKGQCADKWAASVEQTGALRYQDHSSRKLLLPQRLEGRERGLRKAKNMTFELSCKG